MCYMYYFVFKLQLSRLFAPNVQILQIIFLIRLNFLIFCMHRMNTTVQLFLIMLVPGIDEG